MVLILLALSFFSPFSASAASYETRVFVNDGCSPKRYQNRRWARSKTRIAVGETLRGKASKSGRNFVFRYGGGIYTLPIACTDSLSSPVAEKRRRRAKAKPARFGLETGLLSVQEPLQITFNGGSYEALGNYIGLWVGLDWSWPIWKDFEVGATVGGHASYGEAGEKTGDSSSAPFTYDATAVKVFAGLVNPHLYYRVSRVVRFGLEAPVFYRIANWQPTGANYTVSPTSSLVPSLFYGTKLRTGNVDVLLKLGFIRSFDSISWLLGANFPL